MEGVILDVKGIVRKDGMERVGGGGGRKRRQR